MTVVTARPGDERGFLHKRIAKFAGKLGGLGLSLVGAAGIPGVSLGARLGRSFLRGGSRSRGFLDARAVQRARAFSGARGGGERVPPDIRNVAEARARMAAANGSAAVAPTGDACPKGFHLNKSGYHLRDGAFVAPLTLCVKNRRRNNDNGRAAMRAARRLLGRKKSQDAIDRALRAFAGKSRRRAPSAPTKGTTIVQN